MKNSTTYLFGRLIILIVLICGIQVQLFAQKSSNVNNLQYLYPAFANGRVQMKNGTTYQALLNYNTISQCIVWEKDGTRLELSNVQSIDTIFLQNNKFTPFDDAFFEVLVNGPISMFIQHRSNLEEAGSPAGYGSTTKTSSVKDYSSLNMKGSKIYNMELPDNYTLTPNTLYWIRKDGTMLSFFTKRQLLKLFPEKSDEIDKFIKQTHLNLLNHEDLVKLGKFLNTITW